MVYQFVVKQLFCVQIGLRANAAFQAGHGHDGRGGELGFPQFYLVFTGRGGRIVVFDVHASFGGGAFRFDIIKGMLLRLDKVSSIRSSVLCLPLLLQLLLPLYLDIYLKVAF